MSWKTGDSAAGRRYRMGNDNDQCEGRAGWFRRDIEHPGATPGGDTTASWDATTQTATGGGAAASTSGQTGEGPNPASKSVGDATLKAGTEQPNAAAAGNEPGGGGSGGDVIGPGGAGADGAAIIVASNELTTDSSNNRRTAT